MNRLLIIPARGGSKRIKNKNIKKFHNKPIIQYPLTSAKKSKLFNIIHVSTEDKSIFKLAKKIGFNPEFFRDKKLGNNSVGISEVIKFVINKFIKMNKNFDEVWCIYPCSPLINEHDLKKISIYFKKQENSLMTINEFPAPVFWALKKKKDNTLEHIFKAKSKIPSNKIKPFFYDNGCIIILKKKDFLKNFNKIKFTGYEMPIYKSVDIDNMKDWKLALSFHKIQKKLNN
tara:strand:+ start:339 stop:1028 length:690 start_codon:yes stop_codon:yes gene_type:complete